MVGQPLRPDLWFPFTTGSRRPEHLQLLLHAAHRLLQAGQPQCQVQQRQEPRLHAARAPGRGRPAQHGPVHGLQQGLQLPAR